jgi:hypothetical protein
LRENKKLLSKWAVDLFWEEKFMADRYAISLFMQFSLGKRARSSLSEA